MTVSVIVPLNADCPVRLRHWAWLRARLDYYHPEFEVIEAPGPTPWAKGPAIAAGVARAAGDVLVVMDADVLVPRDALSAAVERCAEIPWCVPHGDVHRFTEASTVALTGLGAVNRPTIPKRLDRPAHRGVAGGGIVVLRRDTYELVGPPDPRFVGWGGEDTSWRRALDTLAGSHERLGAPMVHLWHPPQPDQLNPGAAARRLARRYKAAWRRPDLMRALVKEGRP